MRYDSRDFGPLQEAAEGVMRAWLNGGIYDLAFVGAMVDRMERELVKLDADEAKEIQRRMAEVAKYE